MLSRSFKIKLTKWCFSLIKLRNPLTSLQQKVKLRILKSNNPRSFSMNGICWRNLLEKPKKKSPPSSLLKHRRTTSRSERLKMSSNYSFQKWRSVSSTSTIVVVKQPSKNLNTFTLKLLSTNKKFRTWASPLLSLSTLIWLMVATNTSTASELS